MVWYSHLFQTFPQFIVIHTVKGFGIVNKAETNVFVDLSCFFDDPVDVGNLISGSSAFSKTSLNIWKFTVHVLLKPGAQNAGPFFPRDLLTDNNPETVGKTWPGGRDGVGGAEPLTLLLSHRGQLWGLIHRVNDTTPEAKEGASPKAEPCSEAALLTGWGFLDQIMKEWLYGWASPVAQQERYRSHRRRRFNPWVGKIPRRRTWPPTPVFLSGEPHRQRSLAGYSPWGCTESDTTEVT